VTLGYTEEGARKSAA